MPWYAFEPDPEVFDKRFMLAYENFLDEELGSMATPLSNVWREVVHAACDAIDSLEESEDPGLREHRELQWERELGRRMEMFSDPLKSMKLEAFRREYQVELRDGDA